MDRRRRTYRLLDTGPVDVPVPQKDGERLESPDTETIDGITFDYRREPRCHVCAADGDTRILIDQMLARGATYKDILRAIEPLQDPIPKNRRISYSSIRRHQLRHLPVDELAIRQILERRAREENLAIAVGDGPLITNSATFELIRNAGLEAVIRGAVTPSVAETLRAAEALQGLEERREPGIDLDDLHRQVQTLIDVVRARMPEGSWNAVVEEVRRRLDESAAPLPAPSPEEAT